MTKLPSGLYDRLITEGLAGELRDAGSDAYELLKQDLDPADSHLAFVRHLREVLGSALESFPEEDRVSRQAALCNRLIDLIFLPWGEGTLNLGRGEGLSFCGEMFCLSLVGEGMPNLR